MKHVCILSTPDFKPGAPPPNGYLAWHAWAEIQHKAGLRQQTCGGCGLWKFPQECSGQVEVSTPIDGKTMKRVRIERPICLDCASKRKAGGK